MSTLANHVIFPIKRVVAQNTPMAAAAAERWWSEDTVAVVTGSNKGIGLEIARGLAKNGVTTILTARDEQRGLEALQLLKEKDELSNVYFHILDVSNSQSVDDFASWLHQTFGGLDILVNNAGMGGHLHNEQLPVEEKVNNAKTLLETNYYGVQRTSERLIPLMKSCSAGSRIVNISSGTSRLDNLKNEWRERLSNVNALSKQVIEDMIKCYLEDVKQNQVIEKGWSDFFNASDYCLSKQILNAYSRMLARDLQAGGGEKKIYVNCVCPGLTGTDMTSNQGHSAKLGADTAVWLALLPVEECTSGRFYVKRREVSFVEMPFYMNDLFVFPLEQFRACCVK